MKILICDDCQEDIDVNKNLCKKYFDDRGLEAEIAGTTDPEMIRSFDADILLLDVEMPGANGIEIKNQLAREGWRPLIIFVTNYQEAMSRAFNTNTIGFLMKPVRSLELDPFLDVALERLASGKVIQFDNGTAASIENIVWLCANRGYSDFLLADGITCDGGKKSIKAWEAELEPYGFLRVENGMLVNYRYIKDYKEAYIILGDVKENPKSEPRDLMISISVRRRKAFREKYLDTCIRVGKYI